MPTRRVIKIAPSILAADSSKLGQQIAEAEAAGADYIHVDMMDGHFVPNLAFGPLVVRDIRRCTTIPLDVHLMVTDPGNFVEGLAHDGADIITIHVEACTDLHSVIQQIKNTGARVGLALNPATPLSVIEEILPDIDLILVMTVNPGLGGQQFIESMTNKIRRLRSILDNHGLETELEVDGGIGPGNAGIVTDAGANILVAGSSIYASGVSVSESIARIKANIFS